MFKNPSSFKGRIRRLEFGLSIIMYYGYMYLAAIIVSTADFGSLMMAAMLIPCVWFILAQTIKRSHDVGSSGWHLVFPHFTLLLLLVSGKQRPNKYGFNPKRIKEPVPFTLIDTIQ